VAANKPCSPHTLYRWRHRGDGPVGYRIGRHVRYRREAVEAWLKQQPIGARRPARISRRWSLAVLAQKDSEPDSDAVVIASLAAEVDHDQLPTRNPEHANESGCRRPRGGSCRRRHSGTRARRARAVGSEEGLIPPGLVAAAARSGWGGKLSIDTEFTFPRRRNERQS
jgi:hypothetical protein